MKEGNLCPLPTEMSCHSLPPVMCKLDSRGQETLKGDEMAAAVPLFWRRDGESLSTFVSFVHVSMGGMSGSTLRG